MEQTKAELEAEQVAQLLEHPGWQVLVAKMEMRRKQLQEQWFRVKEPAKAEMLRQEARQYDFFVGLAKQTILQGEAARRKVSLIVPPAKSPEQGELNERPNE